MSFTALVAHSIFPTAFTPKCSHIANAVSSRFATTRPCRGRFCRRLHSWKSRRADPMRRTTPNRPRCLRELLKDQGYRSRRGCGERRVVVNRAAGIRRRWRKLHLGLDLASGAIVCAALTHDNVGDSTALPGLLDQLDAPVTGFLADGAYDGASTRNLPRQRYGETLDVVIPPPKDAVIRLQSAHDATVRDRHIAQIRSNGCMAWQTATGYNQRSRIETQMGRWKSVIGPKLKSRSFSRQITEVQLGRKVLNTMTALGRPVFERIA